MKCHIKADCCSMSQEMFHLFRGIIERTLCFIKLSNNNSNNNSLGLCFLKHVCDRKSRGQRSPLSKEKNRTNLVCGCTRYTRSLKSEWNSPVTLTLWDNIVWPLRLWYYTSKVPFTTPAVTIYPGHHFWPCGAVLKRGGGWRCWSGVQVLQQTSVHRLVQLAFSDHNVLYLVND